MAAKSGQKRHDRLAILLEDAANKHGSRAALARALDIHATEIRDLINSRRFVTMRQALAMEDVLGIGARTLLIEAATAKIDEALARGQRSDREAA
jgi:plasmid maintenance system antidote protein VapI